MLQQMSSPPSAQIGEVATLVRQHEGRLCGDASSEASSDAAEDFELPQCKIRRNYNCAKCTFYTQNPRAYLVHSRDVHFERIKIYDCPHCVYASRHHQKLVRHIKMVHEANSSAKEQEHRAAATAPPEPMESIEDLLEEIEECDDNQMDLDDCNEESLERPINVDADVERSMPGDAASKSKSKSKFFSCDKCNYVTHIRARYTKHVKYHSMPMIKCTMCDFRTPYKWNLDRHMKNHGGTGSFHCSMCNFTADIRQSLTVHEMNHHTPPMGQSSSSRRRNRVGASDVLVVDESTNGSSLISKEEEGSGDSGSSYSASDMIQNADNEMITCDNESNRNTSSKLYSDFSKDDSMSEESRYQKQNRKIPRPIPQLIPLNTSTPTQNKVLPGEPPAKKKKDSTDSIDQNKEKKFENLPIDITVVPVTQANAKEASGRKKNESFFDKLKERLLTETGEEGSLVCKNCGFESKCLSEHSVHEKSCLPQANRVSTNSLMSSLSSTRCQNCRHRCKSSADLYVHMQTCRKKDMANEDKISGAITHDNSNVSISNAEKEIEPHPMENVVFVWNNINTTNEVNKFDTPLDININDDSTLPENNRHFDAEIVDDNDGFNLSPSQAVGKKVFKCPHCKFWASTASRFHVHIVGHLNKKPFECSLCKYKSNWRWDITKHIKLKSARDPEHADAQVLMTDETGRRNYSKYNKFLAMPILNENGENEFHYIDQNTSIDAAFDEETYNDMHDNTHISLDMQPLNLQTQHSDLRYDFADNMGQEMKKPKKTLWKCKKCNYKDSSKEALLEHVREHSKENGMDDQKLGIAKKPENAPDPADLAYRCGHCNQLSNWKHVIQRHCRLKHDGIIKVITTVKPKQESTAISLNDINSDTCTKCPYRSSDKNALLAHLKQHQPSPQSIFKCYFCEFFVKDEHELQQHLALHGVNDPEDYIAKAMGCKSPLPDNASQSTPNTTKRHKCTECPYETNSKSQFMYHEQFHRLPADTPYKCPECNYSVSKRHLLHQHLRVHGIFKKNEIDTELEPLLSDSQADDSENLEDYPYVWVSAKNEFHKMYKCRYCSYVNTLKCKLPNHEKIHLIVFGKSKITIYKCLDCKFTCDHRSRLAAHSKQHGEIYGRIYCTVEEGIPDEEQIAKLRKVIEKESMMPDDAAQEGASENNEIKILYFCRKCPARFFAEGELKDHDKFHDSTFSNKCNNCEFSAPEDNELSSHMFVHSDEYHTKTKMLKFVHNSHSAYKEPRLESIHCSTTSETTWVVSSNPNPSDYGEKRNNNSKNDPYVTYDCKECPAKFTKCSALNNHIGQHGSDGKFKCKKCTYAVKTLSFLAKHELLHENENTVAACDYESGEDLDYKNIPLSGTDLFQRKTEAQKRVLIEKDKLVKPNDHFPPVLQADPQFGYLMHGNPEFIYPTYLKNGRQKEKRYKCHKCPSAFEKREQYKIHLSLHGSKQRYKCELCDYSVKYYANYVQHMRKHQMNDEAQAERRKGISGCPESESEVQEDKHEDSGVNIKLAIKSMPKYAPKTDFQQFSISDQQTLRLLQHRRSISSGKEANNTEASTNNKDRKLHVCLLCPYTNQRYDAVYRHLKKHECYDVGNVGHKCSYCDLVTVQSHFLREHLKTHFNYLKSLTPECFVANEDVSFTITDIDDEGDDTVTTDLKLDMENKVTSCCDDKIFIETKTGEVVVE